MSANVNKELYLKSRTIRRLFYKISLELLRAAFFFRKLGLQGDARLSLSASHWFLHRARGRRRKRPLIEKHP